MSLPPRARVAILSEALRVAGPGEAEALGLSLLELAAEDSRGAASGSWIFGLFSKISEGLIGEREAVWRVALRELVGSVGVLPPDVRELAIASGRGRWASVIGTLLTSREAATRRSVATLAGVAGDVTLADAAVELLSDADESVASEAERALLTLALAAADPESAALADHATPAEHAAAGRTRSAWAAGDGARVCEAIGAALHAIALHKRQRVLLAALLVVEPLTLRNGGAAAKWMQDRLQSGHSFLRGHLRRDVSPLSRLRAWQWIGRTAISGACADRLVVAKSIDEHEAVLGNWHLTLSPLRVSALDKRAPATVAGRGAVRTLGALVPAAEQVERLSVEARRGVAAVVEGLPANERDTACEALLNDSEPSVRWAASMACSSRMLGDFCLDTNATVARSALIRRSVAATPNVVRAPGAERLDQDRALMRVLVRSPHADVRMMARQDLEQLCEATTVTAASRVALARALRADRPWVITRLAELIRSSERERSVAIQIARRLGLTGEIRPVLIETVRVLLGASELAERSARDLATATSALADVPDQQATDLLGQATASIDQRVRANAVDAIVQRVRTGAETDLGPVADKLMELKDDAWHRVRGSAVRGLEVLAQVKSLKPGMPGVGAGQVAEQLLRMLDDARPMHRLAGAWVAGRTLPGHELREIKLWPALVSRLRSLATVDPDPRVRSRARLAIGRTGEGLAPSVPSLTLVGAA
ncbi:MAG: hypothetical protein K2Y21_08520 [Phycisphaerales bacterium]|nr:hypothetical protein [Phycisphaerales bacterium]